MECRPGCGACCIAPSISANIPGMPKGKPAGQKCIHLDENMLCRIYGRGDRPSVCAGLRPSPETCGSSRSEALAKFAELDRLTTPDS